MIQDYLIKFIYSLLNNKKNAVKENSNVNLNNYSVKLLKPLMFQI